MRNNKENNKNVKNKGKHKKKVLRVLVYMVLVLIVLSLLFLIGYGVYHLCTSSKYNIAKIEFKGSTTYDNETLNVTSNILVGENLYRISKKDITNNLNSLPYIKEIKIKRKLPDTIIVTIKEHKSKYFAYNKETDKYVKLTSEGIILEEITSEAKTENELYVFGINFDDNITSKTYIADTEINKLNMYERINSAYEKSLNAKKITSVEFKDNNVILTLDYDINVILNEQNLDYNLSFLKSILEKIQGKAGIVDMTKPNPVFTETVI